MIELIKHGRIWIGALSFCIKQLRNVKNTAWVRQMTRQNKGKRERCGHEVMC